MEELSILGPDLWDQVFKFFSLNDIYNVMLTSKYFLRLIENSSVWSRYVRKRERKTYDLFIKHKSFGDWKNLAFKIKTLRKSIVKECYICHLNNFYWNHVKSDESEYGCIARLSQVCWFEVKCDFINVPIGFYEVLLRLDIPTEQAINLDCTWRVINVTNEQELIKFSHGKKDQIFLNQVGKGWKVFCLGNIFIQGNSDIKIHLLGENKNWFRHLKLDWFQLRPIPKPVYKNEREPFFYE